MSAHRSCISDPLAVDLSGLVHLIGDDLSRWLARMTHVRVGEHGELGSEESTINDDKSISWHLSASTVLGHI